MGNTDGQLGSGLTDTSGPIYRATQVLVAANTPLTNVKAMAPANGPKSCAVTNDGHLYCWGLMTWLVNNGATLVVPYAQAITLDGATPLAGVLRAAVGADDACAIVQGTTATEVWCWGYNGDYNLAQGDTLDRRYPTKVAGFTSPTEVSVLYSAYLGASGTTCVLDGTNVRCFGYNGDGQVGTGNVNTPVMTPALVTLSGGATPFDGATVLAGGYTTFYALRTGGTIWAWGGLHQDYASNYGISNVVAVAGDNGDFAQYDPRFLTSDGTYHIGMTPRTPNCGALP